MVCVGFFDVVLHTFMAIGSAAVCKAESMSGKSWVCPV